MANYPIMKDPITMHILTESNLAFGQENGYVIIHNAVPKADLNRVVDISLYPITCVVSLEH